MTWLLNESGVAMTGASPACVQVFTDSGSFAHVLLGMLAGSNLLSPKDAVLLATGFAGYQLSQAQGVAWSRTGGELIEFAIGMLLARLLPLLPLLVGGRG